jgi:cytochrome P450
MPGLSDPSVQDDPFEYYAARQDVCPVWYEEDIDLWVIGGLAETRDAMQDVATFSSRPARSRRASEAALVYHQILSERGWPRQATLQRTDPPVHTRYRKLVNRVFTPAAVREFTPHIDDIARELVDSIAERGECEFVADFALPLPGVFIAEQLGLDRANYRTFRRWADAMLALANRPTMSVEEATIEAGVEVEAQQFLASEFERRRAAPGPDLISMLVHAHGDDEEPFTMHELQDLMHQLVTGGFETTTAAISTGMLLLVQHPDQMELLRERRDLMGNFIEEVLRFDAPVQGLWRQAVCPVSVAGQEIPEGANVMMRFGAANRDPRVFDAPERFDITRHNARNHAAFGFGAHFCVGAALARQEMMSAFTALLDRFETIELAEELEMPVHEPSIFLRPMRRLPLRLTPAAAA